MTRLRQNLLSGVIDVPLSATDQTLQSSSLAAMFPVTAPDIMAIVLEPGSATPEIVWVTAHAAAAGTATIARGQEGTTPVPHSGAGIRWAHGPTTLDIVPDTAGASESTLRRLANNLNLARDPNDQLRVVVATTVTAAAYHRWGANNAWAAYYGDGSVGSMDPREMQRNQTRGAIELRRNQRWVIT